MAALFGTTLTCIDGRIQRPLMDFLTTRFGVAHIDNLTKPGMIKHLTPAYDPVTTLIVEDLEISLKAHGSTQIAVVAHHDCAGNPVSDDQQKTQLGEAVAYFRRRYPGCDVIGVWLGENWAVEVFE
jgi:hypothetical protein